MQPYVPQLLPITDLDYRLLLPLVGQANAALARYDGLLQGIPNPEVMLSPLTTQEAVLSSKIEGTQATVDEVLEQEAGLLREGEKYKDIQEISNYRQALYLARRHLEMYPIRLGFVLELHRILMDSVRGQDKTPGAFRLDQNWIGRVGCSMEQASFVPPNPLQLMDYLEAWENYLGTDDLDTLLLYQKRALSQPMFYLSEYLEAHREEYYARLKAISESQDWGGWVAFFLRAIIDQAQKNGTRVNAIRALYEEMKVAIQAATRSQYTVHLLDAIFAKPIFRAADLVSHFSENYSIHKKTSSGLLRQLKQANILRDLQPSGGRRSAVLCFPRLINLAEGRSVL
jgi:Fic family protein